MKRILAVGILLASLLVVPLGCADGPQVPDDELGEIVTDLSDVPGVDEEYPIPTAEELGVDDEATTDEDEYPTPPSHEANGDESL